MANNSQYHASAYIPPVFPPNTSVDITSEHGGEVRNSNNVALQQQFIGPRRLQDNREMTSTTADMDMCESPQSQLARSYADYGRVGWAYPPPPNDPLAAQQMMLMMSQYGQYAYIPTGGGGEEPVAPQRRDPIKLNDAMLYPPHPNTPMPLFRERPPGCRTIFIGGLPEKATEEVLRSIFESCGQIQSIRLSKKNFAHVRFFQEEAVDTALYYSGYRLKMEDKSEKEYSGKLHIDYAHARDDQYEYEMAQRALERMRRHASRADAPPSPPPPPHYSDHEALALIDKLKSAETFGQSVGTLVAWLEKGDCAKRSATKFYSLIGAVNAHVKRLILEKVQADQDLLTFKEKHNEKLSNIITQLSQIQRVFQGSRKQKNWDHFSKAQRKNLQLWLIQIEDIRRAQENEMFRNREEEAMDESDEDNEEGPASKKPKLPDPDVSKKHEEELTRLKEEMEQYKLRMEAAETKNSKQGLEKHKLESALATAETEKARLLAQLKEGGTDRETPTTPGPRHAKLIALLSGFLHLHPFGASVDYLWSYLQRLVPGIRASDIEPVLQNYPSLFKVKASGVGASYERKWTFIGLEADSTDTS